MRSFRVLISCLALAAVPAAAQEMYPGQSVVVNPSAAGTRVLLYPGNQYVRVLPPLREPGANPLEPIHLHMPVHHRIARIHRAPRVAAADTADTGSVMPDMSAAPAEAPPPAPRHARHPKTEVAADTTPAPDTSASPDTSAGNGSSDSSSAAIPFAFSGNAPIGPSRPAPKPAKVASAEPPPAHTPSAAPAAAPAKGEPGLAKHGEIVFNHDATDPAPAQYEGLKLLAGDLNSALQSGATRVQLEAYGGAPGDKSSDARRLSLKRALAIRQVLIDNGVPSGKIDVRAMGGIDDHGNADRVDVLLRG